MADPVRLLFFGGLGEIGRNCFAIETGGRITVVDCGLMFPEDDMLGVDLVLPDFSYLWDNADRVEAVLLTHGHEDHTGALPYFLERVNVPVYAAELTLGFIRGRLEEHSLLETVSLRPVADNEVVELSGMRVEFVPVTHSVPDGCGLVFDTAQGTIVHTGDFKIDHTPIDGRTTDLARFGELGRAGVRLLLSDSTNAEQPGVTPSEATVGPAMRQIIHDAPGRVIVACFASHLHRVEQAIEAALDDGRKIALLGRSMHRNVGVARDLGLIELADHDLILIEDIGQWPDEEVAIVCTGSQGEPLAALSLMASREHKFVKVHERDTVILSSNPIPGNETKVSRTINGLLRGGARVVHGRIAPVHVSGHANAEELKLMLNLVEPEAFIPVHGEYRQLRHHAALAVDCGVPEENVLVVEDGAIVELTEQAIRVAAERVSHGYLYVDGLGVGDVGTEVLRDRRALGDDGVITCVVTIDGQTGQIISGPDLVTRGFTYEPEAEALLAKAREEVVASLRSAADDGALDIASLQRHIRQALRHFLWAEIRRRPVILPVVMEV